MAFHPWEQGAEPAPEQVRERLMRDAPKRTNILWRQLLTLPGSRYLLTGFMLLIMSMFLRKALYWRLMGSLCLLIGAVRRAFHSVSRT